ncbi:hypothetical protein H4J63_13115 [Pseudoalteromonas sp. 5Ae-yellow]|uniref:hypothetical protein n=1 Tax=Pseudoalteromonas sp. 5Ae-yellow TaxID=2759847 RepID=UPI0015F77408|nr:hypothetical protein [Pseudoalteromonas sp. 5Ae-yellow]MBA6410244.1 hypothetical protein [Pseudoalteromonas sp. 5Ae-yellow]
MNIESEFKDSPEQLEPWLTVIGMLTVLWSPVERYIDQCVSLLHEDKNVKNKYLSLNRKLTFIFNNHSRIDLSEADIMDLINLTKNTVQIRDVCVHGVIESYDSEEITIGKVQGKESKHTVEMFTITHERLNYYANNLMHLNKKWKTVVTMTH